jgi:hypothetical protein
LNTDSAWSINPATRNVLKQKRKISLEVLGKSNLFQKYLFHLFFSNFHKILGRIWIRVQQNLDSDPDLINPGGNSRRETITCTRSTVSHPPTFVSIEKPVLLPLQVEDATSSIIRGGDQLVRTELVPGQAVYWAPSLAKIFKKSDEEVPVPGNLGTTLEGTRYRTYLLGGGNISFSNVHQVPYRASHAHYRENYSSCARAFSDRELKIFLFFTVCSLTYCISSVE